MSNAKQEFLEEIADKSVLCAFVEYEENYNNKTPHVLSIGFTENEFNLFTESLNFEYDGGFGGQELYGTIWYKDGTWSDRGEYDGSEWWQRNKYPDLAEMFGEKLTLKYERYKKIKQLEDIEDNQ